MFEWINDPQAWITLATLSLLEIVLGIDNIIFLSILVNKVEAAKRQFARYFGLGLAMVSSIALLLSIAWVMRLTEPLVQLGDVIVTGRDLILIGGGLFLLWKATKEIHHSVDPDGGEDGKEGGAKLGFAAAIGQILLLDGDRAGIRAAATERAVTLLLEAVVHGPQKEPAEV